MRRSAGSYARAIERRWAELLDRPVILSPRDWVLISDWRERSIPLALIEEAIEAVRLKMRHGRRAPRSLSYLAPSVEEAWQVVVQGRSEEPELPVAEPRQEGSPAEAWQACAEAEECGAPLRALLHRLLEALRAGADPDSIDAELDRELPVRAPRALVDEATTRAEAQLAPFRGRMTPETLAETRRRALARRLRRQLALPRLE